MLPLNFTFANTIFCPNLASDRVAFCGQNIHQLFTAQATHKHLLTSTFLQKHVTFSQGMRRKLNIRQPVQQFLYTTKFTRQRNIFFGNAQMHRHLNTKLQTSDPFGFRPAHLQMFRLLSSCPIAGSDFHAHVREQAHSQSSRALLTVRLV